MKKKLVLIEDSNFIRSSLKTMLTDAGFDVYDVKSAEAILNSKKFKPSRPDNGLLDEIVPDIFILDIELDGIDGIELLVKLRSHDDFKNTPIIVNSSHEDKETIIKAVTSGASDYVIKKDNYLDILIGKVKKFFEKELSTFETTLKHELDWIRYGDKELSFALVVVNDSGPLGGPIDADNYLKLTSKLKEKLRMYDWLFPLDEESIAVILPLASVKNLVILRRKFMEELNSLSLILNLSLNTQIGFSHFPTNAKTPAELISVAKGQIK